VRRHQVGAVAAVEGGLEQVARVHGEGRAPILGEVPAAAEAVAQGRRRLQPRHIQQVVHAPSPSIPMEGRRDLHRQEEAQRPAARREQPLDRRPVQLAPEPEEAGLGRLKALLQLLEPDRVGEVPGVYHCLICLIHLYW
jgi:hypothetical protein